MEFLLKKPAYLSETKFEADVNFTEESSQFNRLSATSAKIFAIQRVGDDDPQYIGATTELVIVDATPGYSRRLYEGEFGDQESKMRCTSFDGIKPASFVKDPLSKTCEGCPMAAYGSYDKEGRKGVACRKNKHLVVALKDNLDELFVMRINTKSSSDTRYSPNPQSLSKYYEQLKGFDVAPHSVFTGCSFKQFDHKNKPLNFPILEFKALGYLSEIEIKKIQAHIDSGITKEMLGLNDEGFKGEITTQSPFAQPNIAHPPIAAPEPVKAAPAPVAPLVPPSPSAARLANPETPSAGGGQLDNAVNDFLAEIGKI